MRIYKMFYEFKGNSYKAKSYEGRTVDFINRMFNEGKLDEFEKDRLITKVRNELNTWYGNSNTSQMRIGKHNGDGGKSSRYDLDKERIYEER